MWYFSWILGLGLAAAFSILNALWFELSASGSPVNFGSIARGASLVGAASTAAVLTGVPFLAVPHLDARAHAILSFLLTGMSAGFVHGLGMRPHALVWRVAFSPWMAWPLLASGWIALLAPRAGL